MNKLPRTSFFERFKAIEDASASIGRMLERERPRWWHWWASEAVTMKLCDMRRALESEKERLLAEIQTTITVAVNASLDNERHERALQEKLAKQGRFVGGPLDGQVVPEGAPEKIYARGHAMLGVKWTYRFQVGNEGPRSTWITADAPIDDARTIYVSRGDANRYLEE